MGSVCIVNYSALVGNCVYYGCNWVNVEQALIVYMIMSYIM